MSALCQICQTAPATLRYFAEREPLVHVTLGRVCDKCRANRDAMAHLIGPNLYLLPGPRPIWIEEIRDEEEASR